VLASLFKASMDTTCSIYCRRCLEDYSETILAHTQAQLSIFLGPDECSGRLNEDAGDIITGNVPRNQNSGFPNIDVIKEAEGLVNDATCC
jgi:hypothetical protein